MKRMVCIAAGLMVFTVCAAAQAPTAGQKVGLATSMQNAYATLKGNLTQAAEKMPEANYGFKPASDPDLRTVWPVDRPPDRQSVHQLRHPQGRAEPEPCPEQREEDHQG